MIVRDATQAHAQLFAMPRSCRAVVGIVDGEPTGIAGYYVDGPRVVMFMDIDERVRAFPVTLARQARALLAEAQAKGLPIHAKVDETVPAAERFMRWLGFVPLAQGVWQWQAWT